VKRVCQCRVHFGDGAVESVGDGLGLVVAVDDAITE
jgi:hypothetical protein